MARRLLLLPAIAVVTACGPDETRAPTAERVLPALDPARVLATYTEQNTELGGLDAMNRFLRVGAVQISPLLPDSAFCHVYFALHTGTYCYRARYREPFQTRRVDALVMAGAKTAQDLLRDAIGPAYADMEDLIFFRELTSGARISCASFFVNQILRSLDGTTLENFHDAPAGRVEHGLACKIDGRVALHREPTFEDDGQYQFWDYFPVKDRSYLVVHLPGHVDSRLQLYSVDPPRLVLIHELDLPGE